MKVTSEPTVAECSPFGADCSAVGLQDVIELPEVWWAKYSPEDILFMDCEFVSVPIRPSTPATSKDKRINCKQVAATVDIINQRLENVYSKRIRHKSGSFLVNPFTLLINGFGSADFDNEEFPELSTVTAEVHRLLRGKLVVTLGGVADFRSLNLEIADYDYFDLQMYWWNTKLNQHGVVVEEKLSLRSLSKFYLKEEVQGAIHTSIEDAKTTAKLFEVYKNLKKTEDYENLMSRECTFPHNDIPVVQSTIKR